MSEKKQGLIYRLVNGTEKDDNYARSTLPTNRWQLFWDIFKGKFFKIIIINLLIVLFLLPLAAVIFFLYAGQTNLASALPFNGNMGMGYPANLDVQLQYIMQYNQLNNFFYLLILAASVVASFGIAGGFYIMRNMVWTEGTFIANDFWRGIKQNILPCLFVSVLLSGTLFLWQLNLGLIAVMEYTQSMTVWTVMASIVTYIMLIVIGFMCLYMLTLAVTYKQTLWQLIKNSFLLTMGCLFQNVFFVILGASPLIVGFLLQLFLKADLFVGLIVMCYLVFGVAMFVLVWTNFSQWVFDRFVNDNVDGAVKNRGIFPKAELEEKETAAKRKRQTVVRYVNPKKRKVKAVTDEEVQLTDLSHGFTRASLAQLASEKENLKKDAEIINDDSDLADECDLSEEDDTAYENFEEAMKLDGYEGQDLSEFNESDDDSLDQGE